MDGDMRLVSEENLGGRKVSPRSRAEWGCLSREDGQG